MRYPLCVASTRRAAANLAMASPSPTVSMLPSQVRRLTPLVILFALVQAMVPAFAAIADAWRLDQRAPYAHIESETEATCAVVHAHDCALCSVATSPTGEAREAPAWCDARAVARVVVEVVERHQTGGHRAASQRAPPGVRV